MDVLSSVAQAIATVEGYFTSGTIANRNNNPGNLRDQTGTIYPSLPHDSGGFVIFPTAQAGWDALQNDLTIKANRGMTITQTISAWAPPSENNTSAYIASVSAQTGLSPDTPLLTALSSNSDPAGQVDLASSDSDSLLSSSSDSSLLIGASLLALVAAACLLA
jgi:hypothetical protein